MFRRFFIARNKLNPELDAYVLFVSDGIKKNVGIEILNQEGYETVHSFVKLSFLENRKLKNSLTQVSPLPTPCVNYLMFGVKEVGEKDK